MCRPHPSNQAGAHRYCSPQGLRPQEGDVLPVLLHAWLELLPVLSYFDVIALVMRPERVHTLVGSKAVQCPGVVYGALTLIATQCKGEAGRQAT